MCGDGWDAMIVATGQNVFDRSGRRIPTKDMRVFGQVSRGYYQLLQPALDFDAIFDRSFRHTHAAPSVTVEVFTAACEGLREGLERDPVLAPLLNGVHVPFVCPKDESDRDLGEEFESLWLPSVGRSFLEAFPDLHFKATLQGQLPLPGHVKVAEASRYDQFLQARRRGTVVGWYFPMALLEYDVASQRKQLADLPRPDSLVLSGGCDVAAALVGSPSLLVNADVYPPVLCLSGLQHDDPRLMLCFKAYGLSLEFWGLSQMLTPTITQVSEQWAGGLTCFTVVA